MAAVVGLSALVIGVLTVTGILTLEAPSTKPGAAAVGSTALPPVPQGEAQHAGIAVSALHIPMSVPGSDGMQHIEYDLVVTNTAATPATLTAVEVLASDGHPLLRLDGAALVAATQPLDGTSPTAEIPGSTAVAVVVDLRLAPDHTAEHLAHRIGYELAGASVDPGTGHQVRGPSWPSIRDRRS
jgi:hypothetical protein